MSRRHIRIIVRMTPRAAELLTEIARGNIQNICIDLMPDTVREPERVAA